MAVLLSAAGMAFAAPQPSPLFSDRAVLQRDVPIPVWGQADPGEKIVVKFRGQQGSVTADAQGRWKVVLPAMAVGAPADLMIEGKTSVVARDVVVGDVWLCAGQSNMELAVAKSAGAQKAASAPEKPWLRSLKLPHVASEQPLETFKGSWKLCDPQTVGTFSAVAYEFAMALYGDGKIPVGLLDNSFGGTQVEAWMSPAALSSSKSGTAVAQRWAENLKDYPARKAKFDQDMAAWLKEKKAAIAAKTPFTKKGPSSPSGPGHYTQPGALFNGMVNPLAGFPVRGVLWYQGESNILRGNEYADLLTAMIGDMRKRWQSPQLPFFIVQIPNYREQKIKGEPWTGIREAQRKVAESDPQAYLVVTVDIGDPKNKHPVDKSEVGRRLAQAAKKAFGQPGGAESPSVKAIRRMGGGILIEFDSQDLTLRPPQADGPSFELAGADGVFHPAQAEVRGGGGIYVSSAAAPLPRKVRYLWSDLPAPILFTSQSLPVGQFESEIR